jgi:hypothetical protein
MKYRNKPIVIDGIRFASQAEGRFYGNLKLLEAAGHLSNITCHPRFPILINDIHVCFVVLGFAYVTRDGKFHVVDVKGKDNALSKLKRKLVEAAHGFKVEIAK